MAKKGGNPQNLKPPTSSEEARKRGRKGGIKSGIVRKEKKLLSQVYAELLADLYDEKKDVNIKTVVNAIMARADSSSVSLLKEIREATEGSKVEHSGTIVQIIDDIK